MKTTETVAEAESTPRETEETQPFTPEALRQAWDEFAEQRKVYAAEYQLLQQPFDLRDGEITLHLLNPVQETILGTLKSELLYHLRTRLRNGKINLAGLLQEGTTEKIMYTPREKFDYLVAKNPLLKELKDRFGLDTDF